MPAGCSVASRIPLPSSDTVGGDSRVRGVVPHPPSWLAAARHFPCAVSPRSCADTPSPNSARSFSDPLPPPLPQPSTGALLGGGAEEGAGVGRGCIMSNPPMGLAARGLTGGGHPAFPQRPLYPTLQTLSPVLTPGSSGVPSHGLTGFPFLAPAQAGKSWPLGPGTARTPPPPSVDTPPPSSCSFLASCSAEFGAGETPLPPGFLQPGPPAWQHPRDMAALG